MEENCKIYISKTRMLVDAYVNDEGDVFYKAPCHGGYYFYPMTKVFMDKFGVTIYPG
jgi:hypothetical protein